MLAQQPSYILIEILRYTALSDLHQCRLVCKSIRTLLDTESSPWPIISWRSLDSIIHFHYILSQHPFTYSSLIDIMIRVMARNIIDHAALTNYSQHGVRNVQLQFHDDIILRYA